MTVTVSYHLPTEILERTQYSVDASIYFEPIEKTSIEDMDVEDFNIEDFNPNNPNICFRDKLQQLEESFYLDVVWALDAESPEAAEKYVQENLGKVIPIPKGLKLQQVALGEGGESSVYDNQKQEWCGD